MRSAYSWATTVLKRTACLLRHRHSSSRWASWRITAAGASYNSRDLMPSNLFSTWSMRDRKRVVEEKQRGRRRTSACTRLVSDWSSDVCSSDLEHESIVNEVGILLGDHRLEAHRLFAQAQAF